MTQLRREVNVPIYWLLIGLAVMLVSPVLSIIASVQIVERNTARQAEANRIVACQWLGANLDVYDETPPTSETGRNLRKKWLDLYNIARCEPARK